MNPIHVAVVAFVAIVLDALFLALAFNYRREARGLRRRNARLRDELNASRTWNSELGAAQTGLDQLLDSDPMQRAAQLPQRSDPLEQLFLLPGFTPEHERGQQ